MNDRDVALNFESETQPSRIDLRQGKTLTSKTGAFESSHKAQRYAVNTSEKITTPLKVVQLIPKSGLNFCATTAIRFCLLYRSNGLC